MPTLSLSPTLNNVAIFISTVGEDLAQGGKVERDTGMVLDALLVALSVDSTHELAAILTPWVECKLQITGGRTVPRE